MSYPMNRHFAIVTRYPHFDSIPEKIRFALQLFLPRDPSLQANVPTAANVPSLPMSFGMSWFLMNMETFFIASSTVVSYLWWRGMCYLFLGQSANDAERNANTFATCGNNCIQHSIRLPDVSTNCSSFQWSKQFINPDCECHSSSYVLWSNSSLV